MINDGLWCTFEDWHMGNAGEVVAVDFGITRAAQDEFAMNSHRKAAEATACRPIPRGDRADQHPSEEG